MSQSDEAKKAEKAKSLPESAESRVLAGHAFELARALGIQKMLVQADELRDRKWVRKHQQDEVLIWLTRREEVLEGIDGKSNHQVRLPSHELSRMEQIQIGLLIAVLEDLIKPDETVLTLTGLVGSSRLDNLLITNLQRDSDWFHRHAFADLPGKALRSREFFRLIDVALQFAREGREGKPVGTAFVLGDPKELDPYVKQMILNPCEGHSQRLRSIHNPEFIETLRELSAIDGAFIVSQRGVVERAGTYLVPTASAWKVQVRPGLGARHTSAAALTAITDALAIVVSESSATVTAYSSGSAILEMKVGR